MRRKVLTNVKTMLTFSKSQGLVAQNVARDVKIKTTIGSGRQEASKKVTTTLLKRNCALCWIRRFGRWRAFLDHRNFFWPASERVTRLRWQDVNLEEGSFHVAQRADAWRNIGQPKSAAGRRDIPLTPMTINALRQWKAACPVGELSLFFPMAPARSKSPEHRNRFWVPLQIKCGLAVNWQARRRWQSDCKARYGFHSLRHAAASLFIAHLNWTPKRVQTVMGHSSITITFDRYGHLFEDHEGDREAMKRLEAAVVAA